MEDLIGISGVVAFLLLAGTVIGLARRSQFSFRWLVAAAGLVLVNDLLLTSGYGLLPDMIPAGDWNWQGKIIALLATLMVASLPAFGWRRSGLTLAQAPGSLKSSVPVALLYAGFFLVLALLFPNEAVSKETIAFQLSMPGLEEEPFYRGVLLLALDRAFAGRKRLLGVDWGWGAVLSCALFGLAHAFGFSDGGFSFDPLTMALTAVPSFIGIWLVMRTRSLLLPILLHNFGNAIMILI